MKNLSVVISTFNRSQSLLRTLESIKNLADEIVIVNNSSTDATKITAEKFTKKIYNRPNNTQLNVNKNYGIEKASGTWILYLDDDEVVDEKLAKEIEERINNSGTIVGFWIPRKNIIFGKWIQYGIWWPDKQMRLFRNGKGKYPGLHVHEYIHIDGEQDVLASALVHYNYETISQYLDKMQNIYIESEVEKMRGAGYVLHWADAIRFPISDFIKLYFAQSGWKDGLHGLVLALLQAFYSFLVFAKLWEIEKFRQTQVTLSSIDTEFRTVRGSSVYWLLTVKMQESKNKLSHLYLRLLRKFLSS